ncbi:MAG: hypothetical protein IH571_01935 [Acholeplasmataceae bacterium]|nr:hypothetical protein [Acholeplasmataceae bacterium]
MKPKKIKKTKKRKKRFSIFKSIKFLLLLIVGAAIYTVGLSAYENIKVNQEINAFKARAIFVEEVEFTQNNSDIQVRRYYEVPRETSYELEDTRTVFTNSSTKTFLGQKGDIFVTQQSPFPDVLGFHQFMSFYYGGHAAIHDGNGRFLEATGFPDPDESVWDIIKYPGDQPHDFSVSVSRSQTNYWLRKGYRQKSDPLYEYYGPHYRTEFIGLRYKHVTEEMIDGVVDYASDVVERKALYNFLFFLDTKYKFYCTDLVSRAYQNVVLGLEAGEEEPYYAKSLNDDGFITSVNDIVLSKETYMHFYVEIIDEVVHIYYLADL